LSAPDGIWFVYRTHDEGPLAKRIRRLAAPSILAWFQAKIEEARTSLAPHDVGLAELGGPVKGLGSLFEAAHKHSVHTPKTNTALRKLLADHLSVEGGDENILLDAHSLRVRTADAEVALAYYFFDDEVARRSPDRVAYLLLDEPHLPADVGPEGGSFSPPVEVSALAPGGGGEGATYVALLTFADGDSFPGAIGVFAGVRLPGLAAHLRTVVPEGWPVELEPLRGLIKEGAAHVVHLAPPPVDGALGQQWILFDDRWAAAHPDLAASILRYGRDWDPFAAARPAGKGTKASKAPKSVKEPKAPRAPKAARPTRASAAAEAAANKHEHAWQAAVGGRTESEARAYAPTERFAESDLIQHSKFGLGVVVRSDPTKCEVLFAGTSRIMLHGLNKA
jgi:hypothetical protein